MTQRVNDNGPRDSLTARPLPKAVTKSVRALNRERRARQRHYGPDIRLDLAPLPPRSVCRDGPRPCPHLRCRHHLGVDVMPSGGLRVYEGWEDRPTCVLDVANDGPRSLSQLARDFSSSPERMRQIVTRALPKLRASLEAQGLSEQDVRAALSQSAGKQSPDWQPTTKTCAAQRAHREDPMPAPMTRAQWQSKIDIVRDGLARGATFNECIVQARAQGISLSRQQIRLIRSELGLPKLTIGGQPKRDVENEPTRAILPTPSTPAPAEPTPAPSPPPKPTPPPEVRATPTPGSLIEVIAALKAHLHATGMTRMIIERDGRYRVEGQV